MLFDVMMKVVWEDGEGRQPGPTGATSRGVSDAEKKCGAWSPREHHPLAHARLAARKSEHVSPGGKSGWRPYHLVLARLAELVIEQYVYPAAEKVEGFQADG